MCRGRDSTRIPEAPDLSSSRASKSKGRAQRPGPGPLPSPSHPQTYPEEGGETLAIVSNGKVVWLRSEDFHDVFIEFCLLDLKEENSQLVTPQMCIKGTFSSEGLRRDHDTRTNVPRARLRIHGTVWRHNSDILTIYQVPW